MTVLYDHTFQPGAGVTLWDETYLALGAPTGPTTEQTIDSIGGPTWVEITGIPFNTFGAVTLKLAATIDAHDTSTPVTSDDVVSVYVAPAGATGPSDFLGHDFELDSSASVGSSYATIDLGSGTFAGPGAARSVYVWCPVLPPSFFGSTMKVKNVHLTISRLEASVRSDDHSTVLGFTITGIAGFGGGVLNIAVTADAKNNGAGSGPGGSPQDDVLGAYLCRSSCDPNTDSFAVPIGIGGEAYAWLAVGGTIDGSTAATTKTSGGLTGSYANKDLGNMNFTNPGIALSVFVNVPYADPDDNGTFGLFKNLRVIISSTAPPPPTVPPAPVPVTDFGPGPSNEENAGANPLGTGLVRPFRRTEHADFATDSGVPLVLSCIGQILGTPLGSLPWEPTFGSNLFKLRHRSQDPTFLDLVRIYSDDAIKRWEPRATVVKTEIETAPVTSANRNFVSVAIHVQIGTKIYKSSTKIASATG